MFKIKSQITNTRAPKSTVASVTTSPTEGTMRLSQAAAELMGVSAEDYVVMHNAEVEGADCMIIGKGTGAGNGSKLAGKSASLNFSSTNAWRKLEGEPTNLHEYTLDVENPLVDEESGDKYFVLVKGEIKPKSKRGVSSDDSDEEGAE